MGIFTSSLSVKLKLIRLVGSEREIDGVIVRVTKEWQDGGFPDGDPFIKDIELSFGEEVIL